MPTAAYEYAKAAIPEPYQILGVRLKPFSLHSAILMDRFDVAFVKSGEAYAKTEDLIFGVLICSKHWDEGEFEIYALTEQCEKDVSEWYSRLTDNAQNIQPLDFVGRAKLFQKYVTEHSQEPAFWRLNQGSAASGAHWTQCVLLTLISYCGYSRKEALHCPLSQALSDYYRYAETQGIVSLMTQAELEEISTLKAQEKEAVSGS